MRARSLRIGAAALVASTCIRATAAAQEPPVEPPPSASASPADAAREEARTHFKAGVILLQDPERPRYEEASTEFKTPMPSTPTPVTSPR